MSNLTSSDLITQVNSLNSDIYTTLNTDFGSIKEQINALSGSDTLDDSLKTQLTALDTTLGTAGESIAKIQIDNLRFINDFKDFAVQNQMNQDITNLYAQNQESNITAIQKAVVQDNVNKQRMVEINRYYTQKNEATNGIIQTVLLGMVGILIIIILAKKSIIPTSIAQFIGWGIAIYLGVMVAYKMYDINRRNNLNFDEYDIPFDLVAKDKIANGAISDITTDFKTEVIGIVAGADGAFGGCIGKDCCAMGTVYNADMKQCIEACPVGCKYANYIGGTGAGCYTVETNGNVDTTTTTKCGTS